MAPWQLVPAMISAQEVGSLASASLASLPRGAPEFPRGSMVSESHATLAKPGGRCQQPLLLGSALLLGGTVWSRVSRRRYRKGLLKAREHRRADSADPARAQADSWPEALADAIASPPRRAAVASFAAFAAAPPLLAALPACAVHLGLSSEALARARGKVVVITGATAGVGLEAARTLLRAGSDVYVTGRTLEKAVAAVAEISAEIVEGAGRAVPMELNLASLASVRSFVTAWERDVARPIDILACNAGLALGQNTKEPLLTEDGFELTVGTNHLGHFLLINLLLRDLSPTARIVNTASSVHDPSTGDPGVQATLGGLSGLAPGFGRQVAMIDGGDYDPGKAYKDSKLCNVLFTLELTRRLQSQGSKVTANCFSPGLIPSATFFRYQDKSFSGAFAFATTNILKIAETPDFGGDTLVFMALDPSLDGKSGLFYSAVPPGQHVFSEKTPSPEARDAAEAAELWRRSAALVGV